MPDRGVRGEVDAAKAALVVGGLVAGAVLLEANMPHHTSVSPSLQAAIQAAAASPPTNPIWDPRFDVNHDGVIDINDAYIVATHVGSFVGQRNYVAAYDFDGDGGIGVTTDLVMLLSHLGATAPAGAVSLSSPPPPANGMTIAHDSDITAFHEGTLYGIPSFWSWAQHPEIPNVTPPGGYSSCTQWWDVFMDASDHVPSNLRLYVGWPILAVLVAGSWHIIQQQSSGGIWNAQLILPYSLGASPAAGFRQEAIGWSWLVQPNSGWHGTPGQKPTLPAGVQGVAVGLDIAVAPDNPALPTTGTVLVRTGADWRDTPNGSGIDLAVNGLFCKPTTTPRRIYATTLPSTVVTNTPPV